MDIESYKPDNSDKREENSTDFNCKNCNQTDCCYWIYYNEINEKEYI